MLQHWYMCTLLVSGFNSTSICNGFTLAAQWTWTGGPWKIPVSFVYVATMFFRKGKVSFSYVITKKKIMFTLLVANKAMCLFQRRKDTNQNQSMLFIATKKGRYWARLFQHNQQRQHTWRISHAKATSSEDMEHVNMKFRGFVWFSVRDRNSNKIRCGPKVRHWFYVLQIVSLKWLWTLERVKHINNDVCLMYVHVSPSKFVEDRRKTARCVRTVHWRIK